MSIRTSTKSLWLALALMGSAAIVAACEEPSPAEESVDEAGDADDDADDDAKDEAN